MYPALFNAVVDNAIRKVLAMTVEEQRVAYNGLGEAVGRCLWVFYSDDSMVGSRDPDWMKYLMNVLIGLFRRYGLMANVNKSRSMTCQPRALRSGMSAEGKALKCTGVGYSYRTRLQKRTHCLECRFELTAGPMTAHSCHMHGMEP